MNALPTTSQVELIDKRKFAKVALNTNSGTFVLDMSALKAIKRPTIYLSQAAQIAIL